MKPNFRELFDDIMEGVLRQPIPVPENQKAGYITGIVNGVAIMLANKYFDCTLEIEIVANQVAEEYAMAPAIEPKQFEPNQLDNSTVL